MNAENRILQFLDRLAGVDAIPHTNERASGREASIVLGMNSVQQSVEFGYELIELAGTNH